MATYNIESFYRATLAQTVLSTDTVAIINAGGGLKVSNVPVGSYSSSNPGFITISPNTDNEEIFEFTAYNGTTKVLTLSKRGINKTSTALTTDGAYAATGDYNNSLYIRSHTINDSVRSDINHIHINQNFSKAEMASTTTGQGASLVGIDDLNNVFSGSNVNEALNQLGAGITANSGFDAIVATTGGTHTLLSGAINSGAQRILVRAGVYADVKPSALTSGKSLSIICEGGAVLDINSTGDDRYFDITNNKLTIQGGTWNIVNNQSNFNFINTTGGSSIVSLNDMDVVFIKNTGANQAQICTSDSQISDIFNASGCRFSSVLSSATNGGVFIIYNNNYSVSEYIGCIFSHRVSGGGINGIYNTKFTNCKFYADGAGAVRNYLDISYCENCVGVYSLDLSIANSSNNYFYSNNMTSDSAYDFGTTKFRMEASGRCVANEITFNYLSGNSLKLWNGCIFTGNNISGGEYIEIGVGDTQYNAKTIVNDNFFSTAFAQTSINSKVKIKQKFSQVSNNSFEMNYGSGGSPTGTLTIDTTANYSMVCNNIIASGSSVLPTIVDSSTGSVATDNLITIS